MLVGWVLCENCGHAHLAINSPAVSPALPTNITPGQALDHPNNHPSAFTNRIFNSHPRCQFNPFYFYIDIWQSPNSQFKHMPKLIHLMFPLSFFISHGKSCQQYLTEWYGERSRLQKGEGSYPQNWHIVNTRGQTMHHNGSYPPVASYQPRQTAKHSRIFPLRGRFPHSLWSFDHHGTL